MNLEKIIASAVAEAVAKKLGAEAPQNEAPVEEPTLEPEGETQAPELESPELRVEVIATSTLTSSQKAR